MYQISIHTFLAEGDYRLFSSINLLFKFQSTPSSRKVTAIQLQSAWLYTQFQSTPSSRKVTSDGRLYSPLVYSISIHTFLAEGDLHFLVKHLSVKISIHTFLAEGDVWTDEFCDFTHNISIHTFLAEGDLG